MPLHLFLVFPDDFLVVGTSKSKNDLLVGLWLSQVGIHGRVLLGAVSLAESSGGRSSIVVSTSFCQSCVSHEASVDKHLLGCGAPCGCVGHGWVSVNLILGRGDRR